MKAISKKLLSLLLTVAIVLQLLPAAVFAEESITENDNATLVNPDELTAEELLALYSSEPAAPAQILFEEEGLREADVKHYRMSDGSFHAVQFEEPVHYQGEDGTWQEINNLLTPITTYAGDTVYSVSNAEESRSFAGILTEDAFFSLSGEGHSLSIALADLPSDHVVMGGDASLLNSQEETAEPCVAEIAAIASADAEETLTPNYLPEGYSSALTYPDVYPGIDLKYELFGYHVKESIIVKTLQDDYTFDFEMNLDGLTATLLSDGAIELTDEAGTLLYYIPAPYMVDAAGNYSDAVTHSLTALPSGGCLLRVEADGEWIESAQLPVTIDPTIYKIVNSDSASNKKIISNYISSGNPDSNYSNGQELYAGYTNANDNEELQIISHINDLPELPQGSTVNAVQISFNQSSYSNDSSSETYLLLQAHELTLTKPSSYSTYEAWINSLTWNTVHPNGAANYDDDVLDFVKMTNAGTGYAITLDLTKIAREWYADQDTNKTLLLKTDASADKRIVATLNMYNIYNKNYLVVAYRNDVGVEGYYTYQTQSIGRAGIGYLSDHTQRLTLVNPLISSPSNVMPFGLSLVYNSAYGTRYFDYDTDIHSQDYSGMILGAGWKLSAQECILPVTLDGDDAATRYWIYTDGDGTEHFFFEKTAGVWKDEDGLGLQLVQVAESGHTNFKLTDEKDNEKYFRDGLLAYSKDAYGNTIYYVYNYQSFSASLASGRTWMPTNAVSNQLTDIYRINAGSETVEHLAEIIYNEDDEITGIYDEARRETFLTYTPIDGVQYLTGLTYPDGQTVSYSYSSGRLNTAYDNEADYGIEYAYTSAGQVSQFREYVKNGANILYGSSFSCWAGYANRSSYRYWGKDNINDATKPATDTSPDDDLRTEVIFDNMGRTVCTYATDSGITEILGSAALSYTENSGISPSNNRITASASSGMTAVNLLPDSSFEKENNPSGWVKSCSGTGSNAAVSLATGHRRLHGSGGINLYLPTTAAAGDYAGIQRAVSLKANTAYTLSGWFSVSEYLTWDEDSKLEILWLDSSGSILQRSTVVHDSPSAGIQDGWQRVSASFVAPANAYYTAQFRLSGCTGTAYLDNLQLEEAETASTYNLVQDGSFEQANGTWTLASGMSLDNSSGTPFGSNALYVEGNTVAALNGSQVIYLNVPASTSFLLSGWAKGSSAPNAVEEYSDTTDRFFGLIVTIVYTDGTPEYHSVSFSWSSEDWQSVAKAIAPKAPEKTIDRIYINCAYNNNSGEAYFDNISLRQEPVQTYTYDDDGNPETVTQTGTEDTNYTYEGADLKEYTSSNNVKYEYDYNEQHDVIEASSDGVTSNYTYNAMGNMTASLLTGGTLTMSSSATYTANGNHTATATDAAGNTTTYTYVENRELLGAITNAKGQTTNYSYNSNNDRTTMVYQSGIAAVTYTYDGAQFSQLDRKTFRSGTEQHQYYNFAYNLWGQSTSVKVGTIPLATYAYADMNGNAAGTGGGLMSSMTYGNGDSVTYTYDAFDRLEKVVYNDTGNYIEYLYTADGALGELRYKKSNGTVINSYTFEYDSLGRLIRSAEYNASGLVQRTEHLYDEHNRLSSQTWNIQGDDFSESYTYNDPETAEDSGDGSLLQMTTATGDKINYTYNALKQLQGTSVTNASGSVRYTTNYAYKQVSGNQTPLIEQREVTANSKLISGLRYSYDALGNILGIYESELVGNNQYRRPLNIYTYDDQNQLLSETVYTYDEDNTSSTPTTTTVYTYTYDTAGNLLTKTETVDGTATTVSYTYGNSQWNDLLTAYDGGKIAYEGQTLTTTTLRPGIVSETVTGTPTSGNPISYYNGTRWGMSWEQGRNLKTATNSTTNSTLVTVNKVDTEVGQTYTYDADGIRTGKVSTTKIYKYRASTDDGGGAVMSAAADPNVTYTRYLYSSTSVSHSYITQNGKVVRETIGSGTTAKVLDFIYDESGKPFALVYTNGTATPVTYYYVLNLQGDVVGLLNSSGTLVANYSYNAWGEILSVTNANGVAITSNTHIANLNPLRYRGYYYDTETGFYYLQSRYYDPVTHRFINADSYASTGQGFIGTNMFAYCLNNPVNFIDFSGFAVGEIVAAITGICIETVIEVICYIVIIYFVAIIVTEIVETISSTNESESKSKPKTNTRVLADVKTKKQNGKHYVLAYVNEQGELIRVGPKMTFTEALSALGITGATNDISRRYIYDKGRSSDAQRQLEHMGTGAWGIYADSQSAAKALAVVFGCDNPPEYHGDGMYGHYHDSKHTFHIWYGGKLQW